MVKNKDVIVGTLSLILLILIVVVGCRVFKQSEVSTICEIKSCRIVGDSIKCEVLYEGEVINTSEALRNVIIAEESYVVIREIPGVVWTSKELYLKEDDYKELYNAGVIGQTN